MVLRKFFPEAFGILLDRKSILKFTQEESDQQ